MKPASRHFCTSSARSCVRPKPGFARRLFCPFVFFLMLLILSSLTGANAQAGLRAAASKDASYEGVVARQITNWGIYTVRACARGIRLETQNDAVCIAKPPDWTIYIYRRGQKRAARITYEMFRTKNLKAVKLAQINVRPQTKKVAGVPALQYMFDVNQRLQDTTLGSLYQTRQVQPVVLKKEVVFAANVPSVPKQAKGVWANFFEIPIIEEIPMQVILHLDNGERGAYFDTKSFGPARLSADDLKVPAGLTYTAQFAEMIYGKETEGVADLLLP